MQYWDLLTNLESELIRLENLASLVNTVTNGLEASRSKDVENSLYLIRDMIEDIQIKSFDKFNDLFAAVTENTPSDHNEYNFDDLNNAVSSWHDDKI